MFEPNSEKLFCFWSFPRDQNASNWKRNTAYSTPAFIAQYMHMLVFTEPTCLLSYWRRCRFKFLLGPSCRAQHALSWVCVQLSQGLFPCRPGIGCPGIGAGELQNYEAASLLQKVSKTINVPRYSQWNPVGSFHSISAGELTTWRCQKPVRQLGTTNHTERVWFSKETHVFTQLLSILRPLQIVFDLQS